MKKVELLAPAGNFESLIAAVQNGADAVYFGANKFNARANSENFSDDNLRKAIEYAKIRGVKTHLTLNILIKDEEFEEAIELVKKAYNYGIDAIIVQDLGLAKKIIEYFPDLEVHSSTQNTIYDLAGVKEIEKFGFSRCVLARELSIDEIKNICENSKIDIEVFIHGALCISYSGQCLMSSLIGGRSGNRGKCAGTCRLPYELIEKCNEKKKIKNTQSINLDCKKEYSETSCLCDKIVDTGYLLSSKDVCTLDILPEILSSGVKSLKIEGRMKSPEYVGIVTSIYRKYIDMIENEETYIVDENDKKTLMQIFNRGGFSTGYLKGKLGKDMMYKIKPNHIGLYLGKVLGYNINKGYVKVKLEEDFNLGDSIAINESSCKISELMKNNQNIKEAKVGEIVTIGRIKGNIKINDIVYKTVSEKLIKEIQRNNSKENRKIKLDCIVKLNKNEKMQIILKNDDFEIKYEKENINLYNQICSNNENGEIIERIEEQIRKTGNTIFEINTIDIEKNNDIYIPIKEINELRRSGLEKVEQELKNRIKRDNNIKVNKNLSTQKIFNNQNKKIDVTVLLNNINLDYNYNELKNIDNIYIPIDQFINKMKMNQYIDQKVKFEDFQIFSLNNLTEIKLKEIINRFNTYVYFPVVMEKNYKELVKNILNKIYELGIKGAVISNYSQLELVKKFNKEIIANYTFNIFNNYSIKELEKFNFDRFTVSPELSLNCINNLITDSMKKEMIVYGRIVLMNSKYCVIGGSKNCNRKCVNKEYVLKDRKGFEFPVITDRINCNTKILNSKINSVSIDGINLDSIRVDIFDEKIEEINNIVNVHKMKKRFEGNKYTNGNIKIEV